MGLELFRRILAVPESALSNAAKSCSLALQLGQLWLGEEGTWMLCLQLQLRKARRNVTV